MTLLQYHSTFELALEGSAYHSTFELAVESAFDEDHKHIDERRAVHLGADKAEEAAEQLDTPVAPLAAAAARGEGGR